MSSLDRSDYARLYGPTVGDRIRLADSDLWIKVEEDHCAGGDEAVFGGGKTIRESMLQGLASYADGAPELVITNVVILDHWGGGGQGGCGYPRRPDLRDPRRVTRM